MPFDGLAVGRVILIWLTYMEHGAITLLLQPIETIDGTGLQSGSNAILHWSELGNADGQRRCIRSRFWRTAAARFGWKLSAGFGRIQTNRRPVVPGRVVAW